MARIINSILLNLVEMDTIMDNVQFSRLSFIFGKPITNTKSNQVMSYCKRRL